MKRKLLSILLVLAMALTLLPVSALAEEMGENGIALLSGTLQSQIDAAENGATVTLGADAAEDISIPAGKSITLDLGGKTLTNTNAGKATLSVAGTAAVKNGTINGGTSYYNIEVLAGGSLTLEGVTATAGNNGSSMISNRGELRIISGTYTGGLDTILNQEYASLTINGGSFELTTINSAVVPQYGYCAVVYNYGTAEIRDGIFTQSATTPKWRYPQVIINSTYDGIPSAKIYGGTFTNKYSSAAAKCIHHFDKTPASTVEVFGGTFNKSASLYTADGYTEITVKKNSKYVCVKDAESISVTPATVYVGVNENYGLNAKVVADDDLAKTVTWASADTNTATISKNGTVTGKAEGSTTITATATAGKITDTSTVIVTDEVASIGDTVYSSLALAIKAAKSGDTIKLLKDTNINSYTRVDQKVTIDFDGKTVTSAGGGFDLYANADVTLTNGTLNTVGWGAWIQNGGKLTVEKDMTINTSSTAGNQGGITIQNTGSVLTVRGTINTAAGSAVSGIGNPTDGGVVINIEDGAVLYNSNPEGLGIYYPNTAELNITGGTITGATGVYVKSGKTTITGGTINGVGAKNAYTYKSGGAEPTGEALVIDKCNYPGGDPSVEIKGGNFSSANADVVGSYVGNGASDPVSKFISGGYYTSAPSKEQIADGYYVVESNLAGYPYTVGDVDPSAATIVVKSDSTGSVAESATKDLTEEEISEINTIAAKSEVNGVAEAIASDKKDDIASAADVSEDVLADSSNTIEVNVNVAVELTEISKTANEDGSESAITKLTFTAKPVATVSVNGEEKETKVDVPNTYLNGKAIEVKLPLPTGFVPKQIKHTSSDGSVEYFINESEGTKLGAGTFKVEGGCAVFTITHFSVFELSGSVTYVEPVYVPGATGYVVNVVPATNGTVSASHKTATAGTTVTVTVSPANGYELSGLTVTDARGNALTLTDLGNGKYSFVMPASKVDVTAAFAAKSAAGFRDVAADAYYAPAVAWAVEKGITNGVTADLFAPAEPCTRGQIVTFLWRAAGSPAPKTSVNPFTDVTSADYYYNAVLWAVENGVTEGTSDTTFSPSAVCTRAQAVTFLCRALKGSAGSAAAFTDVPADAYYAASVNWAVANGVTKGTSDTTFSPDASCTRAEIVTFLYRAYQGK